MEKVIGKIIEIEKMGQDILSDAYNEKKQIHKDTEDEIEKLKNEINENAEKKISQLKKINEKEAQEKINKTQKTYDEKTMRLNKFFNENREKWIEDIFSKIVEEI